MALNGCSGSFLYSQFSVGRTRCPIVDAKQRACQIRMFCRLLSSQGASFHGKKDGESGASVAVLKGCRCSPACRRMPLGTGVCSRQKAGLNDWAETGRWESSDLQKGARAGRLGGGVWRLGQRQGWRKPLLQVVICGPCWKECWTQNLIPDAFSFGDV